MKLSKSLFTTPDEAEAAFYQAFTQCDREAMARLWADEDAICVHPGSHAIRGYSAVVRSWAYIFEGAEPPSIQLNVLSKSVSHGLAVHVVEEHISTGESTAAYLVATNVYRKRGEGWLMLEHHGSLVRSQSKKRTVQ